MPDVASYPKLAEALGVTIEELYYPERTLKILEEEATLPERRVPKKLYYKKMVCCLATLALFLGVFVQSSFMFAEYDVVSMHVETWNYSTTFEVECAVKAGRPLEELNRIADEVRAVYRERAEDLGIKVMIIQLMPSSEEAVTVPFIAIYDESLLEDEI